jgi:vacuolar-type H+-ATPase subunit E/Vma4
VKLATPRKKATASDRVREAKASFEEEYKRAKPPAANVHSPFIANLEAALCDLRTRKDALEEAITSIEKVIAVYEPK